MVWRCPEGRKGFIKWTITEKELNEKYPPLSLSIIIITPYLLLPFMIFSLCRFLNIKSSIHSALCDSLDTPTTLLLIKELLTLSNTYIDAKGDDANVRLLSDIARYITFLLRVFGVVSHDAGIGFSIKKEGDGGDIVSNYSLQ